MKSASMPMRVAGLFTLCLAFVLCPPAPGAPAAAIRDNNGFETGRPNWWAETRGYLARHVRIGTRWMRVHLDDDKRVPRDANANGTIDADELLAVSFLGSIIKLEPQNSDRLDRLYVRYYPLRYLGIEVTYEEFGVKTWTYYRSTDGTLELTGPVCTVFGVLPCDDWLRLRAGVGIADLKTDMAHNPLWRFAGGYVQTFAPKRADGVIVFLGCEIDITENWAMDFYARHMKTEVDIRYTIALPDGPVIDDRGTTTFPLDGWAFGLGLTYSF